MAQDSQSDKGGFSGICMQFKLTIYPMFTSRHQGVLNYSLNTKTVRGWEFSPSLLHWQGSLLHWQGLASSKYNAKQCRAVVFEIPLPPPPTPLSLGAACCNCNISVEARSQVPPAIVRGLSLSEEGPRPQSVEIIALQVGKGCKAN